MKRLFPLLPVFLIVALTLVGLAWWHPEVGTRLLIGTVAIGMLVFIGLEMRRLSRHNQQVRDILEATETSRLDAERRLREVIENTPGLFFQFHLNPYSGRFRFPWLSDSARVLLGIDPERLARQGLALVGRVHRDDRESLRAGVLEALEALCPWHGKFRVVHPDGRLVWLEGQAIPRDLEDGCILAEGFLSDITVRIRIEEELRAQRSHLRRLAMVAERTNDGVVVTNTKGKVEWCNAGFTRLSGYDLSDLLGKKPGLMLQGVDTDQTTRRRIRVALEAGQGIEEEILNYHKDGTPYWVSLKIQPLLDDQGVLVGYMGIQRDISQRRRYEDTLAMQRLRIHLINQVLLGLGANFEENLDCLLRLAGELFQARAAFYHRREGADLRAVATWQAPAGYPESLPAAGTLCEAVLEAPGHRLLLPRLSESGDPRVAAYGWGAYVGFGVRVDGRHRGVLSLVFEEETDGGEDVVQCLEIIAQAFSREELLDTARRYLRETTQELESQSSRLSTLLHNLGEAVLVEDEDRRVTFVNPAFERMFGLRQEDLRGRNCAELAMEAAKHFEYPAGFLASIDASIHSGRPLLDETLFLRDRRVLERCFVPIESAAGDLLGYLWQYRDTTTRHRNERLLKAVAMVGNLALQRSFEDKQDWVDVLAVLGEHTGVDRVYLFRNHPHSVTGQPACSQLAEWNSGDAAPQIDNPALQDLDYEEAGMGRWYASLRENKPILGMVGELPACEQPLLRAQGILSLLEVPLLLDGSLWGFLGFDECRHAHRWGDDEVAMLESAARLLSMCLERQRDLAALREAKEGAESANRAKSVFLSTMSHEIRTPLHGILGYTQIILRRDGLPDWERERLLVIQRSGEHLRRLIDDILDLSRLEAGRGGYESRAFDLENLCKETLSMLRVKADEKGLALELQADWAAFPRHLLADDRALRQILVNLVGNAIKYTERGRVDVVVALEENEVRVSVRDTGVGIDPGRLPVLFQPFSSPMSGHGDGSTGLGLAICQRLVRLMGGWIEVDSHPGQGSEFRFGVPVERPNPSQLPAVTEVRRGQVRGYLPPFRQILVVDDLPDNRAMLSDILLPLGFGIAEASNGREALELARSTPPDLVLCDLRMPVMDGNELIAAWRADPALASIPVLAITASVREGDGSSPVADGFDGILYKPADPDVLVDHLQRCLGLQWIYDPTPAASPPVRSDGLPGHVDSADREILLELAEDGDVEGLRRELARIAAGSPEKAAAVAPMSEWVERFQLETLVRCLRGEGEHDG